MKGDVLDRSKEELPTDSGVEQESAGMIANLTSMEELQWAHDNAGHFNAHTTQWRLKKGGIIVAYRKVKEHINSCLVCQQCRLSYKHSKLGELSNATHPGECVALDWWGQVSTMGVGRTKLTSLMINTNIWINRLLIFYVRTVTFYLKPSIITNFIIFFNGNNNKISAKML